MPTPNLPQDLGDIRITAEQVRRHEANEYTEIITKLVHSNAYLTSVVEELGSQLAEAQAELAALQAVLADESGQAGSADTGS